ncbi:MAG: hypothetical protein WDZ72_07070 [Cyclobacteriaceae bacterium]
MQFSWAEPNEVERIRSIAGQQGVQYVHHKVRRKPVPAFGAYLTMIMGASKIKSYAKENGIQVLMPRSTMPAMMVNHIQSWIRENNIKMIFDADGLPIEERVDFAGLKPNSLQHKWLKKTETQTLLQADLVITRTQKAIDYHLEHIGDAHRYKFFKVSNGRDPKIFKPDQSGRQKIRSKMGIVPTDFLWVYTGTLGSAYKLDEMIALFDRYHQSAKGSRFLFLTRNDGYLAGKIPSHLKNAIIIKTVPFEEVPCYLAAADLGLSLRKQAPSLAGLAPIKIGEYLLSGLPVIASPGVGDTEVILSNQPACFLYTDKSQFETFLPWIRTLEKIDRNNIRTLGLNYFNLNQTINEYLKVLQTLP